MISPVTFLVLFCFGLVWAILAVRISKQHPVYSVVGLAIVTAIVLVASTSVKCSAPKPKPTINVTLCGEVRQSLRRLQDDITVWSGNQTEPPEAMQ